MNKQQLANRIWASANKMRSKIEANEYKDYILGLLFYKFLSDKEVSLTLQDMQNATEKEKEEALQSLDVKFEDPSSFMTIDYFRSGLGYFIQYKDLFSTWLRPNSDFRVSHLAEALSNFERSIGHNHRHVFEGIFNTLRTGLTKLGENPDKQTRAIKELIYLIKDIPTDGQQDYDVLGYVYEYLISNFAASAGKKAGEFYTPHEVSALMSDIVAEHHKAREKISIYDPTSGSGSLLITIGKSVSRHNALRHSVQYYAQELKENTYNLTRMNLVMRGIIPSNIKSRCADSLEEDWPRDYENGAAGEPLYVDAVVSNPPYSLHWDPRDRELDPRFKEYGLAPKSKADYAFLLHELHHLKPDGIMTIVLPHGVLFRGGEEETIRTNLVEKNNIDTIIGLPANIFFGTGIPTLVMVLKKKRSADDILIIDASKGFVKDGKQNKLRACDIRKIADTVRNRADIPGFSRRVSRDEVRANAYNLNIPRYVDSSEPAESQDIWATMFGGIPNAEIDALAEYWKAFPTLREQLFRPMEGKPYSTMACADARATILSNADVERFRDIFGSTMADLGDTLTAKLVDNMQSVRDMQTQDEIATDLFGRTKWMPLTDPYAAFQILAERWPEIMGDIEILQQEGMAAARVVETAYKIKKIEGTDYEVPDGLKGRVIPFALVQRAKFAVELERFRKHEQRLEEIDAELEELRESLTQEEAEAYCDADKENAWDKNAVKADAKPKAETEPETKKKLAAAVALWTEQSSLTKQMKKERAELDESTATAIGSLTESEIHTFLRQKWVEPLCESLNAMPDAMVTELTAKVKRLAEKYATCFAEIESELRAANDELSQMVQQLTGDEFAIAGLKELFGSGK